MAKIGPHELRLRELREQKSKVTLAPPLAIQKALAKEFAEGEPAPTAIKPAAQQQENEVGKKQKKTQKAKPAPKSKTKPKAKTRAKAPKTSTASLPKEGSKLAAIGKLLARPEGCTTDDVLKATGWPSVSMPQQATALGVKLLKEKEGRSTRYRSAPLGA